MPSKNKGKEVGGALKAKNHGLAVKTNLPKDGKVPWELINSAPVTKKERGFEAEFQKPTKREEALASDSWRSHAKRAETTVTVVSQSKDLKENMRGSDTRHRDIRDATITAIPKNSDVVEFHTVNAADLGSNGPPEQRAGAGVHAQQTVKSATQDSAFFRSVLHLPNFTRPATKTPSGRVQTPGEISQIQELANKTRCVVRVDGVGEVLLPGDTKLPDRKRNLVFSITPVTTGEMRYISCSEPVVRQPLGTLHVAKRRARLEESQDDIDAHNVSNATKEIPRAASVSPEFLNRNAGARYDAVERLRDARRILHNDPAVLHMAGYTNTDEPILETSPHRDGGLKKEAGRRNLHRFDDLLRRLKPLTQQLAERTNADTASEQPYEASDRSHQEQAKWDFKTGRNDSGYTSPSRDLPSDSHRRSNSKNSAAIVSDVSSPFKCSHDSGFHSPSKARTLNPKAIEFVSMGEQRQAATVGVPRPTRLARPPVSDLFSPPQAHTVPISMDPPPKFQAQPSDAEVVTAEVEGCYNIGDPSIRQQLPRSMLPPPGFGPVTGATMGPTPVHLNALQHLATTTCTPVPLLASAPPMVLTVPTAPTGPVAPMAPQVAASGAYFDHAPARPPRPCRKPRNPDPAAQQQYEAWVEYKKFTDPEYALQCKRRQARRWDKQRLQQVA